MFEGEKTRVSKGSIADMYCVFVRAGEAPGTCGLWAVVVVAGTPGYNDEGLPVMAPHPLAQLRFTTCLMPKRNLLGTSSGGFKLAMRTLDIFLASVVASTQGFAVARSTRR